MPTINGTPGNDVLSDTSGQDQIFGFAGDDIITVTGPADQVDGGDGIDTLIVSYANATGNVVTNGAVRFGGTGGEYYEVPSRAVTFTNIERFEIYTGLGNDSITTGDFNDIVSTGGGNDEIDTRRGVATVDGGAGNDIWRADFSDNLVGLRLNLTVSGLQTGGNANGSSASNMESVIMTLGGGDDFIVTRAGAFNDQVVAGGGDDYFVSAGGSDTFTGGSGTDYLVADFSAATTVVEHRREADGDPSPRIFSADNAFRVNYSSVERFDIRTGSANDSITTGALSDAISGGGGNDFMNSLEGEAQIDGGTGQDAWFADLRYSNLGIALDLNLTGVQQLGNGSSVANVELVNLTLGNGNDVVVTRFGANNQLVDFFNNPGDATTGLRDVIDAGGGDDIITTGGGGAYGDDINGGSGIDTLILRFEDYVGDLNVSEGLTPGSGTFGRGPNRYSNMERFQIYGGAGNDGLQTSRAGAYDDLIDGGLGDDFLAAFAGNDTLLGGDGNDSLIGGAGNDLINGGAGIDSVVYEGDIQEGGMGGVTVYLNGGPTIDGFGGTDTVTNVENVIATQLNDTVYGNASANNIDGRQGNDTLFGGAGVDVLTGGDGDDILIGNDNIFANDQDTLTGGDGNDILYAESADIISGGFGINDRLIAVNSFAWNLDMNATGIEYAILDFGDDTVVMSPGSSVFSGGGNDTITGSGFGDLIFSGVGNDIVNGGDGFDSIVGELGADQLNGGAGDDRIYFDSQDTVVQGGTGYDAGYITGGTNAGVAIDMGSASLEFIQDLAGESDVISAAASIQGVSVYAGGGADQIGGSAFDDIFWGEAGNDTLSGAGGNDVLVGGAGGDRLAGGSGHDALYGNSGSGGDGLLDTFVFSSTVSADSDAVYDFETGIDKLDVTGLNTSFAALTLTVSGGSTTIRLSGQVIATVVGVTTLTAGDFIFSAGAPDETGVKAEEAFTLPGSDDGASVGSGAVHEGVSQDWGGFGDFSSSSYANGSMAHHDWMLV